MNAPKLFGLWGWRFWGQPWPAWGLEPFPRVKFPLPATELPKGPSCVWFYLPPRPLTPKIPGGVCVPSHVLRTPRGLRGSGPRVALVLLETVTPHSVPRMPEQGALVLLLPKQGRSCSDVHWFCSLQIEAMTTG